MAQNQKGSKSGGLCKKFYKKLSSSTTSRPNPQVQTIPTESDHPAASVSAPKNKSATFFSPKMLFNSKEQRSTDKPRPDTAKSSSGQQHVSPRGNDAVKVAAKPSGKVSTPKSLSLKDDGKFSDYIRKVKDKMRTGSNVGAGKTVTKRDSFNDKISHYINQKTVTKRDSFNDKISHYINRAKIKIRTTSSVGSDKHVSVE